jgi:hypothetical protein
MLLQTKNKKSKTLLSSTERKLQRSSTKQLISVSKISTQESARLSLEPGRMEKSLWLSLKITRLRIMPVEIEMTQSLGAPRVLFRALRTQTKHLIPFRLPRIQLHLQGKEWVSLLWSKSLKWKAVGESKIQSVGRRKEERYKSKKGFYRIHIIMRDQFLKSPRMMLVYRQ